MKEVEEIETKIRELEKKNIKRKNKRRIRRI